LRYGLVGCQGWYSAPSEQSDLAPPILSELSAARLAFRRLQSISPHAAAFKLAILRSIRQASKVFRLRHDFRLGNVWRFIRPLLSKS
jgi:hypothetical protein